MSPELLAYPFLFVTIFFESFVLVTFLSKPARLARGRVAAALTSSLPSVAIIVPCLNEGETVAGTCDSLLALEYPKEKLEILLVDNGSTDNTPEVMERFRGNPQVHILREEERGKHFAVNAGIAATKADIIGCLDADSFVDAAALREIIPCFTDAKVGAATAAMSIHEPSNILQHMQNAEYIFGIALRHVLASVNGLYVTPGPFSLYRREVVVALGGFKRGHQTEDLEMALRLQKAGFAIENAPRARVYTKAPSTVGKLIRQRTRWTTGFVRNTLHEYRSLVGSRAHGALGMIVLPIAYVAIVSGILLFCLALFELAAHTITALQIRAGIPLSYVFASHGHLFDWFYFPMGVYLTLALTTIAASVSLIIIGKRLSKTPGSLFTGILSYLFLYGFIAPLWLMRTTADVVRGTSRSWR